MFARLPEAGGSAVDIVVDGATVRGAQRRHRRGRVAARGPARVPHDAGRRRAARSAVPDGRVLRLPRHHRRGAEPAGLPRDRRAGHAHRDAARRPPARRRGWRARASAGAAMSFARRRYDVAIVGAGPGGPRRRDHRVRLRARHHRLRRARPARRADLSPVPPRGPSRARAPGRCSAASTADGAALVAAFHRSLALHVPRATVWAATPRADGAVTLAVTAGGRSRAHRDGRGAALILATGAQERPVPIAGGTLPGVLLAGAAQRLLKGAGVIPHGRTVLAGSGPLLWLLAWQYLNAGVASTRCSTPRRAAALRAALSSAPSFLLSGYARKGLALVPAVRRAACASSIRWTRCGRGRRPGRGGPLDAARRDARREPADLLLLHQGVVPNVDFAGALGCALRWNDAQACFEPVVDDWGGATVADVFIAGDGGGIAGADAAQARGRLAALAAANASGAHRRAPPATAPRRRRARRWRGRCAGARFLDRVYRPADAFPHRPAGDRRSSAAARRSPPAPSPTAIARGRHRPQPAEGLPALRHGAVPGPVLRPAGDRADRPRAAAFAGGRRLSSTGAFR